MTAASAASKRKNAPKEDEDEDGDSGSDAGSDVVSDLLFCDHIWCPTLNEIGDTMGSNDGN